MLLSPMLLIASLGCATLEGMLPGAAVELPLEHTAHAVALPPENAPSGHGVHASAPIAALNVPGAHAMHWSRSSVVPGAHAQSTAPCSDAAAKPGHSSHSAAPLSGWNVPAAHGTQSSSRSLSFALPGAQGWQSPPAAS